MKFSRLIIVLIIVFVGASFAQTDSLNILWEPNTEPDMYQYLLQRSINSTNNFQDFQTVNHPTTHVVDRSVQAGDLYAYRLAAIDSAGNRSSFTGPVSVGIPQIQLQLTSLLTGQDTTISLSSFLFDADHNVSELQVQISNEDHATVSVQSGDLTISPSPSTYTGPASFDMKVQDPDTLFDRKSLSFMFANNTPQVFVVNIPDLQFDEDQSYHIFMDTTVNSSNYPPDQLNWSFTTGPDLQYNFDNNSRILSIQSQAPHWNGQSRMSATATAPDQSTASDTFSVTIQPINDPPAANIQHLFISDDPDSNLIDLKQYAIDVDNSAEELDWDFWGYDHFQITWHDQSQRIIKITPLDTTTNERGFFRVYDLDNAADTANVQIEVIEDPSNIFYVDVPHQVFEEDNSRQILMDTTVTISNGQPSQLSWSFVTGQNLEINFDNNSRVLTIGAKEADWFGQNQMIATATAPDQRVARDTFLITITPLNDPPSISIRKLFVRSYPDSNLIDLKQYAVDVDDDPGDLNWTFQGFSDFDIQWYNQEENIIRIVPLGSDSIETGSFQVADTSGAADTALVTIEVNDGGAVFRVDIPDANFEEDKQYTIQMDTTVTISNYSPSQINWSFSAGDSLKYSYHLPNRKLSVQSKSPHWYGQDQMIAIATAPDQSTRLDTLTVNISPVNDPPQTSIYNLYVSPFSNNLYNLKLYASDVDHAAIELDWDFWGFNQFNIEWYDQQQNIIEIIPGANATSETGVFKVIDPLQAADTAQVTIIYSENNTAPHLLLPNSMILGEDSSITLNLVNRVIDSTNTANELNWEITAGENLNTNFDSDQLSLSIQPAADWYGQSFITFAVSDPFGLSDQKQLVVEVERRNDIENLTIGDVSDNEATFNIQTEIPSIIDFSYWYNISQITTVRLTNYSTNHSISLQNLVTDTTYYYHMKITDEDGRTLSLQDSSFRTVTTDATDSKQPIVYPNPIKPSEGYSEMIFTNLPEESQKISLYSLMGEMVYDEELKSQVQRQYRINVVENNVYFPSGVYIYMVRGDNAKVLTKGKVVIIR